MTRNVQNPDAEDLTKRRVKKVMAPMKKKRRKQLNLKTNQKLHVHKLLQLMGRTAEMEKDSVVAAVQPVVEEEEDAVAAKARKMAKRVKVTKNRKIRAATILLLERNLVMITVIPSRHVLRLVMSSKTTVGSNRETQELLEHLRKTEMTKQRTRENLSAVVEVAEEVVTEVVTEAVKEVAEEVKEAAEEVEEAAEEVVKVLQPVILLMLQSKPKIDSSEKENFLRILESNSLKSPPELSSVSSIDYCRNHQVC